MLGTGSAMHSGRPKKSGVRWHRSSIQSIIRGMNRLALLTTHTEIPFSVEDHNVAGWLSLVAGRLLADASDPMDEPCHAHRVASDATMHAHVLRSGYRLHGDSQSGLERTSHPFRKVL